MPRVVHFLLLGLSIWVSPSFQARDTTVKLCVEDPCRSVSCRTYVQNPCRCIVLKPCTWNPPWYFACRNPACPEHSLMHRLQNPCARNLVVRALQALLSTRCVSAQESISASHCFEKLSLLHNSISVSPHLIIGSLGFPLHHIASCKDHVTEIATHRENWDG